MFWPAAWIVALFALLARPADSFATQCLLPEFFIDELKAKRSGSFDPVGVAAAFAFAEMDLGFEGKLHSSQRMVASDRDMAVYKFRDVRWLKGPRLGRSDREVILFQNVLCGGDCIPSGPTTTEASADQNREAYFGRWPRSADTAMANATFGVVPHVVIYMCDRFQFNSSEPDLQAEFDRVISNMRAAADREERDIVKYRKKKAGTAR